MRALRFNGPVTSVGISEMLGFGRIEPGHSTVVLAVFSCSKRPIMTCFSEFLSSSPSGSFVVQQMVGSGTFLRTRGPAGKRTWVGKKRTVHVYASFTPWSCEVFALSHG